MWVRRLFTFVALALVLVACGGKSVRTLDEGEAGAGPECEDTVCGDECVDTATHPRHCGACDARCGVGATCLRGGCCEPPWQVCGNACVDVRLAQDHCGACGNACGFGTYCRDGRCVQEQCPFGRCGDVCFDFANDPNNCGGCGISCGPAGFCSGGTCIGSCDGLVCDGVCVDPWSDPLNCGSCGALCLGSGLGCVQGRCQPVCPPDTLYCDGKCVDWRFDRANCGGCNVACMGDTECVNGACVPSCPSGTFCGGTCVDLASDPNHCGTCFSSCPMPSRCVGGSCIAGVCGDGVIQSFEEADPPPGPLMAVPVNPMTCRYDFSNISQWYCNGTCGNWGGIDDCDQADADVFCQLKMDNPRSRASQWATARAAAAPGVCCPPPSSQPGSLGCTSLGVLSSRGVTLAVSVHPTNLLSTHQGGTVITNLVCTDP